MVVHLWGRCPGRIGFPFGPLAAVLFGSSLFFQSCAVSADSIPYAADIGYSASRDEVYSAGDISPTQDDACRSVLIDLRTGLPFAPYTHFTYTAYPILGDCWYLNLGFVPPLATTTRYGWGRELSCPRGGLPIDRMAEAPLCGCPPGQDFPPINTVPNWNWPVPRGIWNEAGRPWCVPATTPSCPIGPIPEYTPDPEPVDITAPNFKLGTQLACMQNAIRASNGTSRVNSGYRSGPYNRHLQQVWDKWREFLDAQRPECAAELATAENHKNAHELVARPANSSAHTRGEAFDLSSGLYDGILDVLGFGCGLRRPDPIGDPPHFIPR